MALDLSTAQAKVEALMEDACTVTEGAGSAEAATFDRDTLTWSTPAGSEVYAGAMMFRVTGETLTVQGSATALEVRATAKLPLAAPLPAIGAVLEVTSCLRDAEQVGRVFRVIGHGGGTFRVSRQLELVTWVAADPSTGPTG